MLRRALLLAGLLLAVLATVVGLHLLQEPEPEPEWEEVTISPLASPTAQDPVIPTSLPRPLATASASATESDESPQNNSSQEGPPGEDGSLAPGSGRIVDEEHQPIPGALVLDAPLQGGQGTLLVQADREGRFALPSLPQRGLLEVTADGFASRLVPYDKPRSRELLVVLLREREVRGEVVAAESNRPLVGARIEAQGASWRAVARSDSLGRFSLRLPHSDKLSAFVSSPGRVGVLRSEEDGLRIALEKGRVVRGRVLNPDGSPASARVLVYGATQSTHPHLTRTDPAQGQFVVSGIDPEEEFGIFASSRLGTTPYEFSWLRPHDLPDEIEVRLIPYGQVVLVRFPPELTPSVSPVHLPAKVPPPPPPVQALSPQGGMEAEELVFSKLVPGRHQLELDGRAVGNSFLVRSGEVLRLNGRDFPLPLAEAPVLTSGDAHVRVLVLDEGGRPLPEVTVILSCLGHELERLTTGAGMVEFADLPQAPVTFSAACSGRVLLRPALIDLKEDPIGGELVLVLTPPTTLRGQVVPPLETELRLLLPDGELVRGVRSSADGSFELPGLPHGTFRLETQSVRGEPKTLDIVLPRDEELTILATPQPGG